MFQTKRTVKCVSQMLRLKQKDFMVSQHNFKRFFLFVLVFKKKNQFIYFDLVKALLASINDG